MEKEVDMYTITKWHATYFTKLLYLFPVGPSQNFLEEWKYKISRYVLDLFLCESRDQTAFISFSISQPLKDILTEDHMNGCM